MRAYRRRFLPFTIALALAAAPLGAQAPGAITQEELDAQALPAPAADDAALEREAEQAYADGNLPHAVTLYRQLAERQGEPRQKARLLVTGAWLAFQLGDVDAARRDLETALFEDPETYFRTELYTPDFVTLHQDALRDATTRRRREAIDLFNRAVAEIAADRYPQARELLRQGLRLMPDEPDGVYNLAVVDLRSGDTQAALSGFERVLALERGNPQGVPHELKSQALNNAAVIYFGLGQYADAETALAEAVRLEPEDAKTWFNLALTREKLGRSDEAFAALRRARELDPRDVDIARQLALAHIARQGWVEAVALLIEATRAEPTSADLWMNLGRAQRGMGNLDGAVTSFERAIELDAANREGVAEPSALLAAEVRLSQKDGAGAAAAAERATQWRPDRADGWMLLGLARLAQADNAGARAALERAAAIAPQRADIAHNLGTVYLEEKDLARAAAAFRRVAELDPNAAEAREVLARIEAQIAAQAPPPPADSRRAGPRAVGARLSAVDYKPLGIRGLLVEEVAAGGAAARAGLAVGDLVLRADDRPVESVEALERAVRESGRALPLAVLRQGKPLEIRLSFD